MSVALFSKRSAKAPAKPLPVLHLTLIEDTAEFDGRDGPVSVHGFDLQYPNGSGVPLSDDGPVEERVYYFRVAGISHHQANAQGPNFAPRSQVFLVREPTNTHDPNAIQVLGQKRQFIGYVPSGAAASMATLMKQVGASVAVGMVTKTFGAHGKRNAIEVMAAIERNIEMTGEVEVDDEDVGTSDDDLWKLQ